MCFSSSAPPPVKSCLIIRQISADVEKLLAECLSAVLYSNSNLSAKELELKHHPASFSIPETQNPYVPDSTNNARDSTNNARNVSFWSCFMVQTFLILLALFVFCNYTYKHGILPSLFHASKLSISVFCFWPCQVEFPQRTSELAMDFILSCLEKHPGDRPTVIEMLQHPWMTTYQRRPSTVRMPVADGHDNLAQLGQQQLDMAVEAQQVR